jgi:hypothetical protein
LQHIPTYFQRSEEGKIWGALHRSPTPLSAGCPLPFASPTYQRIERDLDWIKLILENFNYVSVVEW